MYEKLFDTREEAEAACGENDSVAIDAPSGKWCLIEKMRHGAGSPWPGDPAGGAAAPSA